MFLKNKTKICVVTLLLFFIILTSANSAPAIVVESCKQINESVPFNTEYWVECYIRDAGTGLPRDDEQYAIEITKTTTDELVWHTNNLQPECVGSYEGGALDDVCKFITFDGGGTPATLIITDPFEVGVNYTVEIYSGNQSNETTFIVTEPAITVLSFDNITDYWSDVVFKGRLTTVYPTTCVAYLIRDDVGYTERVERVLPIAQNGKSIEVWFNTLGLVSGRTYDFRIECDDYSSYDDTLTVQMMTPSRDFEKGMSLAINSILLILALIFGAFIFLGVFKIFKDYLLPKPPGGE